jgi:hypothetical protein
VFKARLILTFLVLVSPLILFWEGSVTQGLVAGIAAGALAITAATLRQGETEFLVSVIRPVAVIAIIPALWIFVQVLPLPPLAHPIWASTQAALGHRVLGTISIDPAASIIALGQYLIFLSVALVSAAVAVDRNRAEPLLFSLTVAAAIIALFELLPEPLFAFPKRDHRIDCLAIGIVIATTTCVRLIERYQSRHSTPLQSVPVLAVAFGICSLALCVCLVALFFDGTGGTVVAASGGLAAFFCLIIIRRYRLGVWGLTAAGILMIGIAYLLVASHPMGPNNSVLLAFADSSSASSTTLSDHILADAPLFGTGAGTFSAVARFYQQINESAPETEAATTAATLAIELGRPMLWVIVPATIFLLGFLLYAALQRGRDSYYAAMGASCFLTLFILAFVNSGLSGTTDGLMPAVAIGIAIAQSKGRTLQP